MIKRYGDCIPAEYEYSEDIIPDLNGRRPFPNDPLIRTEIDRSIETRKEHFVYAHECPGFTMVKFLGLNFNSSEPLFNWKEVKCPEK